VEAEGMGAFDRTLVFNEFETLQLNLDNIRRDLYHFSVQKVVLIKQEDASGEDAVKAEAAVPGQPSYSLSPLIAA
jgi:hypothetical protein